MEKDFEGDEIRDTALIKEGIEKSKDYVEAAKWISSHLAKKYGFEFKGIFSFEYDQVANRFILKCGSDQRVFEEDEIGLIPSELKFLRKMKPKVKK
jgi:hypothetical protein